MHSDAMTPYGLALLAYSQGRTSAEVTIRRDDGLEAGLPVRQFFRSPLLRFGLPGWLAGLRK